MLRPSSRLSLLCVMAGMVLTSGPAEGGTPAGFSDVAVEEAIEKGIAYLWSLQDASGSWGPAGHAAYPVGPTALITYALLESGISPQDARMVKALDFLARSRTNKTYSLGLRSNVWLTAMKAPPRLN